jgi:2'-5' RNA ligase
VSKRLFFAADLDDGTRKSVGEISASLRERARQFGAGRRVSWVHESRMHLTLHFLGEADAVLEQRALLALAEPVPLAPFALAFDGVGFFPPRGSPRVLWLGVSRGLSEIGLVHQEINRRLGTPPTASEPFKAHLTLARFRDRVPRGEIREITAIEAQAGPCVIDRVTLYESRLSSDGPTYLALGRAHLKART